MSSKSPDLETSFDSDDSEMNFIACYELQDEGQSSRVSPLSPETSSDSGDDDAAYTDEPLADAEWIKKHQEETKANEELERSLKDRLQGNVELKEWILSRLSSEVESEISSGQVQNQREGKVSADGKRRKYNGKHYKQLHGTAMGSPVSVVIAEIVMQNIEERALSTCRQTIPLWLRYVDDTFTAVRHDEIDAFHNHLNEQNTDIQFTREVEENGKLPFLDCLVSHNDNSLRTTVYRKPTHTDRLLDESSYNPTSHKATTIRTLTRRAQLVCDSTDSLSDENKYLHRVFTKNNYNNDFIRRNTHRPTTTTETNDTATPTTTATIPYIKGMSENISRILLPFNIRVAHKPITTLRQLLTNVKDKDEPRNRQGTIYKINCSDCQASYIGETGRNLTTRLTEHRRATRKGDVSNHIAEHHRLTNHNIDWDSAQCLTYSTDYFQRLTLESWFTNLEQTPLNRCQQLPAPYKRLIHDINITNDRKRTT
ncbi:hypothetical protein AWC38_SpisGene9004 [Stylophora pistillata]|uniref:GIY-YIG domain-containing protein n=1 Tax=Stylophora pistillata TaxID=50429 RepID=A0A2B4SB86_STYPI|nr:hypothetical protein AWC38_SpisGene9004 [Stylophora pistillata]